MDDVNSELGKSATALITLNDSDVRGLAGIPSGQISMDDLRGKSNDYELVYDNFSFVTERRPEGIELINNEFWVAENENDNQVVYSLAGVLRTRYNSATAGTHGVLFDEVYPYTVRGASSRNLYRLTTAGGNTGQVVSFNGTSGTYVDGCWDGTYFCLVDETGRTLRKYGASGGNAVASFSVSQAAKPRDVAWDPIRGYFMVVCITNRTVYRYTSSGTFVDSFSVAAQCSDPVGICLDSSNFWILNYSNDTVYRYR
jgi:hypothetical protein